MSKSDIAKTQLIQTRRNLALSKQMLTSSATSNKKGRRRFQKATGTHNNYCLSLYFVLHFDLCLCFDYH